MLTDFYLLYYNIYLFIYSFIRVVM